MSDDGRLAPLYQFPMWGAARARSPPCSTSGLALERPAVTPPARRTGPSPRGPRRVSTRSSDFASGLDYCSNRQVAIRHRVARPTLFPGWSALSGYRWISSRSSLPHARSSTLIERTSTVGIDLPEVVAELRSELALAIEAGKDEQLRFEVGPIELELTVAVEKSGKTNGKVKFWVVEMGAEGRLASTATQKVNISLIPRQADRGRAPEYLGRGGSRRALSTSSRLPWLGASPRPRIDAPPRPGSRRGSTRPGTCPA